MSKYGKMNLLQLKAELKKRNARVSGRKQALIERCVVCDGEVQGSCFFFFFGFFSTFRRNEHRAIT